MRIAFLTFEFPDVRPGGVGSYVVKCAGALAAVGHEPHIFTLSIPETVRRRLPAGVHLHEVQDVAERVESGALAPALAAAALAGTQAAYKLLVGALLGEALRAEHLADPFNVVEAAECEGLALPLLVRPIDNLPVVVQIHLGYAANSFGNSVPAEQRDHLAEGLELASIVAADALCAATQSVVDVTKFLCPFNREVAIIPHAVELASSAGATGAPAEGGVLFVGRLSVRKGCDVLASAANIFLQQNPRATIRIAGSDTRFGQGGQSMLADMITRVDDSLRDRFIYLGELSQSEVRREVECCRFQVVPSVVENFANTAVDAMAAGRLVIYGGHTGLDEVVGDAGLSVWPLTPEKLAREMDRAWNNETFARELGLRAAARVRERFDPRAVSRTRVAFYRHVISNHQTSGQRPVREWQALSGVHIQAVAAALISQMSGTVGLRQETSSPGMLLTDRLTALANRLHRPPHVWLFGAGRYTLKLLGERYRWESLGHGIAGIVDEHPRFREAPTYLGFEVKSPSQLCSAIKRGEMVDAIILSTDTLEEMFRRRAKCFVDIGIPVCSLTEAVG